MLHLGHVGAVSFDVGGTLIEARPSVGEVYAQVAREFGLLGLQPATLEQRFHEAWRAKTDFDYSQEAWFELVRQTFGERAVDLPEPFFPAIYDRFAQPQAWHLFDDVLPVLDELASHDIRMAIVSNWDERLRPLLARLGLASYFDVIVPSCEVAFHKPSPVVFEQAIRKLGLPPERILHVGNHYAQDVEGARSAGMQSLQIVRSRPRAALHEISTLLELPAIIEAAGCSLLTVG